MRNNIILLRIQDLVWEITADRVSDAVEAAPFGKGDDLHNGG